MYVFTHNTYHNRAAPHCCSYLDEGVARLSGILLTQFHCVPDWQIPSRKQRPLIRW